MKRLLCSLLFFILMLIEGCSNKIKRKNNMEFKLNFNTQYSQFYLSGDNISPDSDWDEQGYNDRLGIFKNLLVVYTECYGNVRGEINILTKENVEINYNLYDHIVEGGLEIKTDKIQILDCPNSSVELEIPIQSGLYRVRVYSSNLSSVDGDDGDDYYKIEIWKDDNLERKVLKKYIK